MSGRPWHKNEDRKASVLPLGTSLGRWLNLNASKELAWEGAHPDLMDTVACSLAPDATNDIKDVRAQMNGEKPSPADEGHPEGGQPVWIPNTNSTKNGGGATQKTPWGELTMTPGKEAQGELRRPRYSLTL
jgi:hypothetical protein